MGEDLERTKPITQNAPNRKKKGQKPYAPISTSNRTLFPTPSPPSPSSSAFEELEKKIKSVRAALFEEKKKELEELEKQLAAKQSRSTLTPLSEIFSQNGLII